MTDNHPAPSATPTRAELLERAQRLAGPCRDHREARQLSTRQRDAAILALDDAGVPIGEIARATGLSRTQVYRVVAREHVRRRGEVDQAS